MKLTLYMDIEICRGYSKCHINLGVCVRVRVRERERAKVMATQQNFNHYEHLSKLL